MSTVFVTVGTDHHPFGRLIGWVEEWSNTRGTSTTVLVQHGSSPPMTGARNWVSMPLPELQAAHRECDVVVGQVGPGTIADANAAGKRPLVVPRRPDLREVVDDHQMIYGHFMAQHERVYLAEHQEIFDQMLDRLVAEPRNARLEHDISEQAVLAALQVRDLMTSMIESRAPRPGIPEVTRRLLRLGRASRTAVSIG